MATKRTSTDPFEMLKSDHDKVKELFEEFEGATQRSQKQRIASKVMEELKAHSRLEEDIFYPAFRETANKEGKELVAEAVEEHHVADSIMEEMQGLSPSDEQFEAKFTVLMESVQHHIEEEEGEMFPMAKKALKDQATDLASRMQREKQQFRQAA